LGINSLDDLMELFEDEERETFLKMFKINKVLGMGGYGVVLSVKDIQFNKNLALKVVYKKDIRADMLKEEYNILKELKHDNIIKIYSLINFESFVMMSMKQSKENLAEFAEKRIESGNPLNEEECA